LSFIKRTGLVVVPFVIFGASIFVASPLIRVILIVLGFVAMGILIERGLLPHEYWPFRRMSLRDLVISAGCLVAALVSAMAILLLRHGQAGMITSAVIMIMFLIAGLIFFVRGIAPGGRRTFK
jgi:hypothetical protein